MSNEQPNDEAKSTQKTDDALDTAKLVKSSEVKLKGSEDESEHIEADAALESGAREAKEAEKFDHGKHDAGKKK